MNKAFWLTAGFDLLVHCFAIEYTNTHTHTPRQTDIYKYFSSGLNQWRARACVCVSIVGAVDVLLIQIWWYFIWNFNKRKTLHLIPTCVLKSVVRFLLFEKCFVAVVGASFCYALHRLPIELIEWCLEQIVCLWLNSRKWTMQQRRWILRKAKRLLLDTDIDT